jgi:excisionase family DNA binding protein
MAEDWITTQQAAELSGYHPTYLRDLIRAGIIKARKFGPTWQIDRAAFLAYVSKAEKSEDKRRGAKKKHS